MPSVMHSKLGKKTSLLAQIKAQTWKVRKRKEESRFLLLLTTKKM